MAMSGARNCALASSKFSLRTRRTYSGEKRTLSLSQAEKVGEQTVGAVDPGGQLPPQAEAGIDPAAAADGGFDQDAALRSGVVRERIRRSQQIDVARVALSHEIRAALLDP